MTINIATNNWAFIAGSNITASEKQEVLKKLVDIKPSIFFKAFNQFMANNKKDTSFYNDKSTIEIERVKGYIKKLATNRSYNKTVTRSLALAIYVKFSQLRKIIDSNFAIGTSLTMDYTLALLGLGKDDNNYKQLVNYFSDLKPDASLIKIKYNTWFKKSYDMNIFFSFQNDELDTEFKAIGKVIMSNMHLGLVGKDFLSCGFKNVILNQRLGINESVFANILRAFDKNKQKPPKINIIINNSKANLDNNLNLVSNRSLLSKINKISDDELRQRLAQQEPRNIGDNLMYLPVNSWEIRNEEKRIINIFGAFFSKVEETNLQRAKAFLSNLMEDVDSKNTHTWIFDFRMLSNLSLKRNEITKIFSPHKKAMQRAVDNFNNANYTKIEYTCIHVPVAIGFQSIGEHNSITHKNPIKIEDHFKLYADHMHIFNEIRKSNYDEPKKNMLIAILAETFKVLKEGGVNEAKGLFLFTLMTILAENLDSVKAIGGCKSAKDRATVATASMLGLKAVIENKYYYLRNVCFLNNNHRLDNFNLTDNNLRCYTKQVLVPFEYFLSNLIKSNQVDIEQFTIEDKETFFANFDQSILYCRNLENYGVPTNINSGLLRVFKGLMYNPKLQHVYNKRVGS